MPFDCRRRRRKNVMCVRSLYMRRREWRREVASTTKCASNAASARTLLSEYRTRSMCYASIVCSSRCCSNAPLSSYLPWRVCCRLWPSHRLYSHAGPTDTKQPTECNWHNWIGRPCSVWVKKLKFGVTSQIPWCPRLLCRLRYAQNLPNKNQLLTS